MLRSKRSSPLDGRQLDEEDRPLTCPNCGAEREGEYCHGCGQRFMKARLTAWELWWLFAERFLDWEEGVWRTFLKMATAPGVVIRHYLGGKRKTYLNPFSYLLFCAGLYTVGQLIMRQGVELSGLPGLEEVQELGTALNNTEDQFTLIAYGTVLAVAVLALAIRVMFDGRLLNSMEAVVTSIYTSGNVFVLSLMASVFWFAIAGVPLPIPGLVAMFLILFPVCLTHVGYGLFESWGMTFYTAMAPIVALLVGSATWFLGIGVVAFFSVSNPEQGLFGGIVIAAVVIPALVPYLLELFS